MPQLEPPLLQLVEVSKEFDSPGTTGALRILARSNLEVRSSEAVAIMGPSGSGKSTLLHLIGALDRPTSGQVLLRGQDLSALNDADLATVRNRHIGFVFQAHYLLPQCTVFENVLVPTLVRAPAPGGSNGRPPAETPADRARRLLNRVGLGERLDHRPAHLSGGERQRVAVVRALINRPELLLADEPTGSLDQAAAAALGQLLVDLNREEGTALVVVTHALELARRMSRVYQLRDGRLVDLANA